MGWKQVGHLSHDYVWPSEIWKCNKSLHELLEAFIRRRPFLLGNGH